MEKNIKKVSGEKIVLIVDHAVKCENEVRETCSYRFTSNFMNGLMSLNGVNSEKLYIGGNKEKLICFLASMLKDYQSYQLLDLKFGFEYDRDEDFDYDLSNDLEEGITN